MKTRIAFTFFLTALIGVVTMSFHSSGLCDSPLIGAGHAGDPGNPTCKGCHAGPVANAGIADLQIVIGDGSNTYQADSIYDITVSIAQPNLTKAGFEIIALDSSLNNNGGTLLLTDTPRTRITFDVAKRYLTSTPCGADVPTTGMNEWSFKWQAPSIAVDTITFYLAALATNHNDAVTGDTTYVRVLKLTPKIVNGIENAGESFTGVTIQPNPADNEIFISVNKVSKEISTMKVFNAEGKLMYESKTENRTTIETSDWQSGIYFLQIVANGKISQKKFLVNH